MTEEEFSKVKHALHHIVRALRTGDPNHIDVAEYFIEDLTNPVRRTASGKLIPQVERYTDECE